MTQAPLNSDSTIFASHKRIHDVLLGYWESERKGRAFPKESEIDPSALSDVWDSCYLVCVFPKPDKNAFKYSYLGSDLIEAWGDDLSAAGNQLIDPAYDALTQKFDEVIKTGKPLVDESEFVNSRKMRIKYRTCMLPLGTPPDNVEYILGGMKWKAY